MSLDIKRMQKLAGILTEGFSPSEESARYTKSSLKSRIKEMILKEMEDDELEEAKKQAEKEAKLQAKKNEKEFQELMLGSSKKPNIHDAFKLESIETQKFLINELGKMDFRGF